MLKRPIDMNLQLFADGEVQDTHEEPEAQEAYEKIELTEEELQKKIESESDKKLDKALKTAREKWEKEFNEKLEKEKKEAERLAKLSEKERKEEELNKREEELNKRLAEIEKKELKTDAIAILNEKSLPAEFADLLLSENAEGTLENINKFEKSFNDAVAKKVKETLAGTPPKIKPNNSEVNPWSKEHYNLTEQGRLLKEDPEKAKLLMKQAKE